MRVPLRSLAKSAGHARHDQLAAWRKWYALDVTAANEVACAPALLRFGRPQALADRPENRLRLTLGLRRKDGRWLVADEHRFSRSMITPREPLRRASFRP